MLSKHTRAIAIAAIILLFPVSNVEAGGSKLYCSDSGDDASKCDSSHKTVADIISSAIAGNSKNLDGLMKDMDPDSGAGLVAVAYDDLSSDTMDFNLADLPDDYDAALEMGSEYADAVLEDLTLVIKDYAESVVSANTSLSTNELDDVLSNVEKLYTLTSDALADCGESDCNFAATADNIKSTVVEKASDMSTVEEALNLLDRRCTEYTGVKSTPIIDMITPVDELRDKIDDFNNKYAKQKGEACSVIQKFYNLMNLLENLQAVRVDGISVWNMYQKKDFRWDNNSHHLQIALDLRFYPDLQNTFESGVVDPNFSIENDNSWMKWEDNDKEQLGTLLNSDGGDSLCKGRFWFHLDVVKFQFVFEIDEDDPNNADVGVCVAMHDHELDVGLESIVLPFGYLASMSAMTEAAKQNGVDALKKEIQDMLGMDDKMGELSDKLAQLSEKLASLNSRPSNGDENSGGGSTFTKKK